MKNLIRDSVLMKYKTAIMKRMRRTTIARCLWSMKIEIIVPPERVTIMSPTFKAHFCSGTIEKSMSGRGVLKVNHEHRKCDKPTNRPEKS